MVANGDGDKQIWALEFGWLHDTGVDLSDFNWMKVSPLEQADYLVRAYQKALEEWPWMGVMFVWNLDFSAHYPDTSHQYWFSIINEDYTPRPAYLALKEMTRWAHVNPPSLDVTLGWGGTVSPGDWYLFMQAVGFFWWPLMNIASFWSQFHDGLSASERVFALIDAEPKVVQVSAESVEKLAGRIEFRRLAFAYTAEETVLPDFTLEIHPQETLALVGHTGAGKSSLARLMARFYEFQEGELLIDGRDIRRLDLGQYRQHIGLVPQEPFLFSGSVRDNIRYGRPEAADAEVREAAMHISQGDWLAGLADGLDTDVGERGANLSMGQRQLVALARVLLKDPAIFILDEATASVDPFTETQIQEGLETIMRARTAIVIAHRLSTVKNADRIIVMDHGQIIEEGTHDQLMAQGGHYAELYNTYFRHQSLEYIESFVG